MGKIVKFTLIGLISLIALLAIAAFIITKQIDKSQLKNLVLEQANKHLTEEVQITGDINIKLFPLQRVEVTGIKIANPDGFTGENFLSADKIAISLKILPLLRKKIHLNELSLIKPSIILATSKNGETNWDKLIKKKDAQETTEPKEEVDAKKASKSSTQVQIRFVHIIDADITWDNLKEKQRYSIESFNLSGHNIFPNKPFSLTTDGILNTSGEKEKFFISVDNLELSKNNVETHFNAVLPRGLSVKGSLSVNDDTLSIPDLKLGLYNLNIDGNVTINKLSKSPDLKAEFSADKFDPTVLLKKMNIDLPNTIKKDSIRSANGKFSVSKPFKQNLTINPIKFMLGDITLTGNATLNEKSKRLDYNLALSPINADRYLVQSSGKSGDKSKKNATKLIFTESAMQGLRKLNTKGQLSIERFTRGPAKIEGIRFSPHSNQGLITLPVSARLYGGSMNGTATINVQGSTPKWSENIKLNNIDLAELPGQEKLKTRSLSITGKADVAINLHSIGNNHQKIIRTSRGNVSLNTQNGELRGIDIDKIIGDVDNFVKKFVDTGEKTAPNSEVKQDPKKTTRFKKLLANCPVKNGVLTCSNDDVIILLSRYRFTSGDKSKIDFGKEKIDFRLEGRPLDTSSSLILPITIKGNLESPKISVDFNNIISKVVLDYSRKQIQKNVIDKLIPAPAEGEKKSPQREVVDKVLDSLF